MIDNSRYLICNFGGFLFWGGYCFKSSNVERMCLNHKYKPKCFSNYNAPEIHQKSLLKLQILGIQQMEVTCDLFGKARPMGPRK